MPQTGKMESDKGMRESLGAPQQPAEIVTRGVGQFGVPNKKR